MAVNAGVKVVATTRNKDRFALLESIADVKKFDAALDLLGNSVLLDSLAIVHRGGRVCQAGFLGRAGAIAGFQSAAANGERCAFPSAALCSPCRIPLGDVPLQSIVDDVAAGRYKAKPSRVLPIMTGRRSFYLEKWAPHITSRWKRR